MEHLNLFLHHHHVQNFLVFTCFQQGFSILLVAPRTATSAESIVFYMLSAMFSYLACRPQDGAEDGWGGCAGVVRVNS